MIFVSMDVLSMDVLVSKLGPVLSGMHQADQPKSAAVSTYMLLRVRS